MEKLKQNEFSKQKKKPICEFCPEKIFKNFKGLMLHESKMHSKTSKTLTSKMKLMKKKHEEIKESFNFDVRQEYSDYKMKQNEKSSSRMFRNFFKFEPINPSLKFYSFDNQYSYNPFKTEKKILEMIFSSQNDELSNIVLSLWHDLLKMFHKDIKKYMKSFNVKNFDIRNIHQPNYPTKVKIYRQLCNEVFTKIVNIFQSSENVFEPMGKSEVIQTLTLRKYQLDMICDLKLSFHYLEFYSSRMIQSARDFTHDQEGDINHRLENVKEIYAHVCTILEKVKNIKIEHIQDFDIILNHLLSQLSTQKNSIKAFLEILEAGVLIPERVENVVTTKKKLVNLVPVNVEYLFPETHQENNGENISGLDESIEKVEDDHTNGESNETKENFENRSIEVIEVIEDEDTDHGPTHDTPTNLVYDSTNLPKYLDCLKPETWLNGSTISHYLQIINRLNNDCFIFETYFMNSFETHGFDHVKSFYTKEKAFNHSSILIPVNEDNIHWFLIYINLSTYEVFCFDPYNFPEKRTEHEKEEAIERRKKKRMNQLIKLEMDYLVPKIQINRNIVTKFSLFVYTPPEITAQNDFFNCGVFLLAFSKAILAGQNLNFFVHNINQFREVILTEITKDMIAQEMEKDEFDDISDYDEDISDLDEEKYDDVSENEAVKDNFKEDENADKNKKEQLVKDDQTHQHVKEQLVDDLKIKEKSELIKQQGTHTQQIAFPCDLCEKVVNSQKALDLHISSHAGSSGFKCPLCTYKAETQEEMKVHFSIHDDYIVKNDVVEAQDEFDDLDDDFVQDNENYDDVSEDEDVKDNMLKNREQKMDHGRKKKGKGKHSIFKEDQHAGIPCPEKQEEMKVHMSIHDDIVTNIGTNDVFEANETSKNDIEQISFEDLDQHIPIDFDFDPFKEQVNSNNDLSRLNHDEENDDIDTPPISPISSPSTSLKEIKTSQTFSEKDILKKRKLYEIVDEENVPAIVSVAKNLKLDNRTQTDEEKNVDNTRALETTNDSIEVIEKPNQYVDFNLIDYPKLNDPKVMEFYLDKAQYDSLDKMQQQSLYNFGKDFVRYKGKNESNLYNKRNFRGDPTGSIQYLQFYEANYIKEEIKFHVKIRFKMGDVTDEKHLNTIFVQNGLFKQDNLKPDEKPFPKSEFQLQNISLHQFRLFVKLFS